MQYPVTRFALNISRLAIAACVFIAMVVLAGCNKFESEVELPRPQGAPLVWSELRGQWVLVNYWAAWCKPCLREIPELNSLSEDPAITLLGVNFDGISGAELSQLGQRMNIEFDLLNQDPGPQLGWQTPIALPATLVINPQGELQQALFGEQTQASVRAAIGL